jgi:hypothetical protein
MPKFHGIKIEATGQNIITLGDGNQVKAEFGELGQSLSELRNAVTSSEVQESTKLGIVADIDTIQSQLAKPEPNPTITILKLDPSEVLINLMTSWITRFLSVEGKHFERLLGPDLPRLRQLQGQEQEEELVRCYAAKVARAGNFNYTCTLPAMKGDQDAFHFYMIYATRHPRGVEVFKETERAVIPFMHETRANAQERRRLAQSGQYSLLSPEAHYRERRFTEFQLRNFETAKKQLLAMLQGAEQVPYDEAWYTVMQFSAVTDRDLKDWLTDWKSSGSLTFGNVEPGQKLPRKGANQYLKWVKK